MKFGVDVGVFAIPQTGVARYLRSMLARLMEVSSDVEFMLYSPRPIDVGLPPGPWRLRCDDGARSWLGTYWLQYVCPWWLMEDGVDVFWGQNHNLPLRLRRPCLRLLTVHDLTALVLPRTMPLRTRLAARLQFAGAARRADLVVAVSQATAALTRRLLGVSASRIHVIPEGAEDFLSPPSSSAAERVLEARFPGLKPGFILSVSTIEPRKDHVTVMRAHDMLRDPPLLVLVGGPGWNSRRILSEVRARERLGRARYLGRVADEELRALYATARLLVYSSRYEGFGLPVLEAMAGGCPVLCSWTSSLPEVGGSAVRYFRPRDSEGLASELSVLLSNDEMLADMSSRGVEIAPGFSFRTAAEHLMSVVERALNGHCDRLSRGEL